MKIYSLRDNSYLKDIIEQRILSVTKLGQDLICKSVQIFVTSEKLMEHGGRDEPPSITLCLCVFTFLFAAFCF